MTAMRKDVLDLVEQHNASALAPHSQRRLESPTVASASIEAWLESTQVHRGTVSVLLGKRKRGVSSDDETPLSQCKFNAPSDPAHSVSTHMPSTPTTDSRSSKSNGPKSKLNAETTSTLMEKHHLHFKNLEAWERYPNFKQDIRTIVNSERKSTVKPASVQKYHKRIQDFESANEDTFLENVLPRIIKETRTAHQLFVDRDSGKLEKKNNGQQGAQKDDRQVAAMSANVSCKSRGLPAEYIVCDYYDDGLRMARNAEFRKDFLPNIYLDHDIEAKLAKAMAKEDGMSNPRPDYTYGLKRPLFPTPDGIILSNETIELLDAAPSMHQAFLIIEGKSDREELAEAENQARRGGAALVNAGRMLRKRIGEDDVRGPDTRTFVFSATMGTKIMEIWVHWAEVLDTGTLFHMNLLASKSLSDDEALPDLRRKVHNILDWGCLDRLDELRQLYTRIFDWAKKTFAEMVDESLTRGTGMGSKKRKMTKNTSSAGGSK